MGQARGDNRLQLGRWGKLCFDVAIEVAGDIGSCVDYGLRVDSAAVPAAYATDDDEQQPKAVLC